MTTLLSSGLSTGVGSYFKKEAVQTVPISGDWLVPVGEHYITLQGANCSVQVVLSDGTTWRTIYGTGVEGFVKSDGVSVRVHNANAGATEDVEYVTVGR